MNDTTVRGAPDMMRDPDSDLKLILEQIKICIRVNIDSTNFLLYFLNLYITIQKLM